MEKAITSLKAEDSIRSIAVCFSCPDPDNFQLITTLYAWGNEDVGLKDSESFIRLADNSALFSPNFVWGTYNTLYEVEVCIRKPFLLLDQLEPQSIVLTNHRFLNTLMMQDYDSIIVTSHPVLPHIETNYIVLLDMESCYLRCTSVGTTGDVEVTPNLADLEQTDPAQIRRERDMLAEAIGMMGIKLGHIRPDAVLTGPHLLMICDDIVEIHKPIQREKQHETK